MSDAKNNEPALTAKQLHERLGKLLDAGLDPNVPICLEGCDCCGWAKDVEADFGDESLTISRW